VTLDELVAGGRLEEVRSDRDRARAILEEAARHLASSAAIAGSDPNGAYHLLYDAARKAIWAHMLANGYRPAGVPGAHATAAVYIETTLPNEPAAAQFDRMRRSRNRSEYGTAHFTASVVAADLEIARSIVAAVTAAIA